MIKRQEILEFFSRIARQKFGEAAHAEFSANDSSVIEIHTAQLSASLDDINRFNTSCKKCWVTTNASQEIIICHEI